MHEMNTCAVRGMTGPGAMCGMVIVGGKFCGHDGACEHKRIELCEANDEIKPQYWELACQNIEDARMEQQGLFS